MNQLARLNLILMAPLLLFTIASLMSLGVAASRPSAPQPTEPAGFGGYVPVDH